jgi:putative ABC transport system permease protein
MAAGGSARWLALHSLRYRLGQSIVLALLSVTAVAACAAGPMYERAVEQAAVRSQLALAATADRGVSIYASSPAEARSYLPTGTQRGLFGTAVAGVETPVTVSVAHSEFVAVAAGRDDICAHLRIVAGQCPTAGDQVLVSSSSARAFKLALGQALQVTGTGGSAAYPIGQLVIAGLYQPFDSDDDYWFQRAYSTAAGLVREPNGDSPDILHSDALLLTPQGVQRLEAARAAANSGSSSPFQYSLDLPLDAADIGLAESGRLVRAVREVQARIDAAHPDGDPARGRLVSKLVPLLERADAGRGQSRLIIPTLAVQLALVVLVVLALVLAVGVEQRWPELALARLRGRSRRQAARLYIGEIAVVVAAALLPGLLLAWLACAVLAAWWLPAGVHPEWRAPVLAAAVAVSLVELALAVALGRRAAARPIGELLRSVPPRLPGRGIAAAEAGLAVAALAGVLVALSGGHRNAVALLAPSLIAILAGLLLGRLLVRTARWTGRRALWGGRLALAMSALQAARRPGFRRVVTLVCVAVALLVSSVDQWRVASINRTARAQVTTGAAVVLNVNTPTAARLRGAVEQADPAGSFAMPVVIQRPAGGDTQVLALDPARLRRIAGWGSARDTPAQAVLDRLLPADRPAPIRLTGSRLRLQVGNVSVVSDDPAPSQRPLPVSLWLHVQLPDGSMTTVTLPIPTGRGPFASTGLLGGCAAGCTLSRIELVRAVGDFSSARVSLDLLDLAAGPPGGLVHVPLGAAGDWQNSEAAAAAAGTAASISLAAAGESALRLRAVSHGSGATLQHLDVPVNLPCLSAGGPDQSGGADSALAVHGIDGAPASCQPVGTIPLMPGLGTGVLLTDLDLAISSTAPVLTNSTAGVWLRTEDPAAERSVSQALAAAGIAVTGRTTAAAQQAGYDRSPPAWAIQAALASAVVAALIAALMVVIAGYATEPVRSYDLAALRLLGVSARTVRRGVLVEQLAGVLVAALVGVVVGLVGARLALPSVPLFLDQAAVPRPLYGLSAGAVRAVLLATVAVLVVLVAAGYAATRLIGRRVGPDRLREGMR